LYGRLFEWVSIGWSFAGYRRTATGKTRFGYAPQLSDRA
jgi:hypothetical protein